MALGFQACLVGGGGGVVALGFWACLVDGGGWWLWGFRAHAHNSRVASGYCP